MAAKERSIKFRLTEEEYELLDDEREKCKMNMSSFIRDKLLREGNRIILNPELIGKIREENYEINKIGVNINQIVASCHSKGFTTITDLENLKKQLALVEYRQTQIIDLVKGELGNGNNKTATNKGDERRK